MKDLPTDTPIEEIERLYRIDRMIEESQYALAEKKFEEDKAKRLREEFEEKSNKEVELGKRSVTRKKIRGA